MRPFGRKPTWYEQGAGQLHISAEEYLRHVEDGERWCCYHLAWEAVANFAPSSKLRSGYQAVCREGNRAYARAHYYRQRGRTVPP
jgi:hypothetical protein